VTLPSTVRLKTTARWSVVLLLTAIMVSLVGFSGLPNFPSYTERSRYEVSRVQSFASEELVKALQFIDANVEKDAVIATWWEQGSFVNLIANRATIVDDEPLPYWTHLMARHLILGQDESDILGFLASHNATHLLLNTNYLTTAHIFGYIGSGIELDRFFAFPVFNFQKKAVVGRNAAAYFYAIPNTHLLMHEPLVIHKTTYAPRDWRILGITLRCDPSGTEIIPRNLDVTILVQTRGQPEPKRLRPDKVLWNREGVELNGASKPVPTMPATLLCFGDAARLKEVQIGLLSNTARQSLMVRLFVLDDTPSFLKKIYPTPDTLENTTYRVWKIKYPEGIAKNPDFVRTNFPPGPLSDAWLHDRRVPPSSLQSRASRGYQLGNPYFYLFDVSQ
jgi:hypothetical protein